MDKEHLETRNISIGNKLEIAKCQNVSFSSGQMTDVNVWNRSLSTMELQDFSLNCSNQHYRLSPPYMIDWQNVTMKNQSGSISGFNISREEICLRADDQILLFKLLISFEKSFSLCKNLGGKLYLPKNMTELQKFIFQKNTGVKLL